MNRLRDDVGADPVAERGIEMLRDCAATPSMPELKRKVWGTLQQQRLRATPPRRFHRLRFAAAAVVVLGLAGTAGAVLSQRWIKRATSPAAVEEITTGRTSTRAPARPHASGRAAQEARPETTQEATQEATQIATHEATQVAAPGNAITGVTAAVPGPAEMPRTMPGREASRLPKSVAHQAQKASARPDGRVNGGSARPPVLPDLSAASVRERTEVLDALVALRRDRDPERASRLLASYLSAHPRGVLREEAMVLAIEAAAARGDGSTARQLAREYQTSYPGGRFGAFAREHAADRP